LPAAQSQISHKHLFGQWGAGSSSDGGDHTQRHAGTQSLTAL